MSAIAGRGPAALAIALFAGLPVQVPAAVPGLIPQEAELDEIVVRGTRLRHLREAIIEAEDRFLALYNELNENDDYDVHCRMEAPTGSLIKRRVCRIVYVEEAESGFAQAQFEQMTSAYGGVAPHPEEVYLQRRDDYIANALAVINSDPRLIKLIRERNRLEQKYIEERRKRMARR